MLSKLSRESYFAIADEAKRQELDFVGHIPDSITAREACAAGQKSTEHIMYSGLTFDCSSKEEELRQQRQKARDVQASAKLRTAASASFDPRKAADLWGTLKTKGRGRFPPWSALFTGAFQIEESKDVRDSRLDYLLASVREKLTLETIAQEFPSNDMWAEEIAGCDGATPLQ